MRRKSSFHVFLYFRLMEFFNYNVIRFMRLPDIEMQAFGIGILQIAETIRLKRLKAAILPPYKRQSSAVRISERSNIPLLSEGVLTYSAHACVINSVDEN